MSQAVNISANDSEFIPGNLYLFCIQHGLRNISRPVIVSPGGCTVGPSGLRPIGSACSTSGCIPFQFLSSYSYIMEQLTNCYGIITICGVFQESRGSCSANSFHQLNLQLPVFRLH